MDRPFVLGIAGPPGAGKTTLARALTSRRPTARVIHYDTYQPLTRLPLPEVQAWHARGGDPNEIDHADLVADLRRETRPRPADGERPLLVFETPFGRLHKESSAFIDLMVWIDIPLDLALARAVLVMARAAHGDAREGSARRFVDWQLRYLADYPLVRAMYLGQIERVRPLAEWHLDGTRAVGDLAGLVHEELSSRLAATRPS